MFEADNGNPPRLPPSVEGFFLIPLVGGIFIPNLADKVRIWMIILRFSSLAGNSHS
ncbi:hypothetical protein MKK67_07830 [Methylobacterium sp. J-072]|uniref:hypothetical protein n=1 Tax=Methylobacterium sp. J-072 TaxID=2836651 RepID=UPI001FB9C892|nr:hypothetical protein [Methylobacterium sp. J-072]MCJ2092404.1 hypothetical protein [Methylobacterium sp. J-072]